MLVVVNVEPLTPRYKRGGEIIIQLRLNSNKGIQPNVFLYASLETCF